MKAMWDPGCEMIYKNKDPEKVAQEIYSIGDNPTKKQIVDKARDPETELHSMFEWRDDVAAEKWREEQAGLIFRKLKVVISEDESLQPKEEKVTITVTPTPVRMFYGDPENTSGFVSITKIMTNQDTYNALLQRAIDELTSFKKKYSILAELKPLFNEIDKLSR